MSKKKSQGKSETQQKQAMPLKEIREELDMTQAKFAAALSVDASTISRAERGLSEPVFTIKQVKDLCKLAKKSLDQMPDYLGKDHLDTLE
ncbi:MAG: helix-turn-helix transcriptional regulator [Cyanobacteria bacterium J06621_12]